MPASRRAAAAASGCSSAPSASATAPRASSSRSRARLPSLAPSLNVFSERGTHRLQAGPFASRELARDTAEQVRNGLQLAPVIVERR